VDRVKQGQAASALRTQFIELAARGLISFTERVERDVAEREAQETVAVYLAVAERMAPVVGLTVEQTLGGLVWLCEGDGPGSIPRQVSTEAAARLREQVVQVAVSYALTPGQQPSRDVVVLYGPDRTGVRKVTVSSPVDWDDLPAPVREQAIRENTRTLTLQLYPA